jgi:hypothetical protein
MSMTKLVATSMKPVLPVSKALDMSALLLGKGLSRGEPHRYAKQNCCGRIHANHLKPAADYLTYMPKRQGFLWRVKTISQEALVGVDVDWSVPGPPAKPF